MLVGNTVGEDGRIPPFLHHLHPTPDIRAKRTY